MELGFKTKCYPTKDQAAVLSRWIGCQRFIKNSKINEWDYFRSVAKLSDVRATPDQRYSQFISEETSFLKEVPSQILRNGAYLWMRTLLKAFKGECGFPVFRSKRKKESVLITGELFEFKVNDNKSVTLTIGTKKFPVGVLKFNKHKNFRTPKSIVVTKEKSGKWSLSFCYIADDIKDPNWDLEQVESLDLKKIIKAYDRGVAVPVAGKDETYQLTDKEKKRLLELEMKRIRYQRRYSRKTKGSKNQRRAKIKSAKISNRIANINLNFAHQTSHKITETEAKVIVFEDLRLKNMTKSAKGTKEKPGKKVRQKARLNKAILKSNLGKICLFTEYKAKRKFKHVVYINPYQTSQECAECGHIHPDNRKTQSEFLCLKCLHKDNADRNAARVLEKRALNLILDLGTGLSLRATVELIASGEYRKTSMERGPFQKKRNSKNSVYREGTTKISNNTLLGETSRL